MATVAETGLMTADEFLELPTDDGVDRMLIRGELREGSGEYRTVERDRLLASLARRLNDWSNRSPNPGDLRSRGFWRLRSEPDTVLSIDVAYRAIGRPEAAGESTRLIGPPTLAVELSSKFDRYEELYAAIDEFLAAGVPLVWVVDHHFKTVTVYRPDRGPEMFHGEAVLQDDAHLPGLRIVVKELF